LEALCEKLMIALCADFALKLLCAAQFTLILCPFHVPGMRSPSAGNDGNLIALPSQ
jgi:hypothetical protein